MQILGTRRNDPTVAEAARQIDDLTGQVASLDFENEELRESFASLQLAMEDRGWIALTVQSAMEFSRDGLGRAAALCRILAVSNPLVKRGLSLRNSYVWGRGVEIQARTDDVNQVISTFNDLNRASLTGSQAREELERALGTDGNLFLALFTSPLTGRVQVRSIPFEEITDVIANPDDRDEPWFYLRRWTSIEIDQMGRRRTIRSEAYYPALGYRPRSRWKFIDDVEVMWDAPIKHVSVNRLDGWDFGVGDAYAAMPWARAYKEFLTDWARLMKSLSRFAWQATSEKSGKAQTAAAKLGALPLDHPGGSLAGGVATTAGVKLEAISKSGASIDADSGRPLAAMIAAAFGVPVTMLLADPGQTGARAVAETLDEPTRLEMAARQSLWADSLRDVYDYVVDQAIKAPRGPLTGTVGRDEYGNETITLAGDVDRSVEISFPDLDQKDPVELVTAIAKADETNKVPAKVVARLLLLALGVEDVDKAMEDMLDADGNYIDPLMHAGQAALDRFNRGQDTGTASRSPADEG